MVKGSKPTGAGAIKKKAQLRRVKVLEQAAACQRQRNFQDAEQLYLELLRDNPRDADAALRVAELYRQLARPELAPPLLANLLVDQVEPAQRNELGVLWHRLGHPAEARAVFERALALQPGSMQFRYNLGLALRDLGLPLEAADCFSANLATQPDHLPSLQYLGIALRDANRLQAALDTFRRMLALSPDNIDAWRYMALIHVDLAQIDEGIRCWEKVLELDPACSLTYLRLSHLRKRGHDVAAMETLYGKADKPADKINLAFGLGKALEDGGDYDRAFQYLLEGNQLKRRQFRYSIDEWQTLFDELKDIFSAEFLQRFAGVGVDDETPIFIVGMPRSGSSLIEQILASHPDVFGAGELPLLPKLAADGARRWGKPFPGFFRELSGADWHELGRQYIDGLRMRDSGARRITDKLPQNFRLVGAISIMLPRATIIHCRRSPMDNCWSMYKNLFAEGHPYTYDLQELGRFYRYYQNLMRHWSEVLPGRIHEIEYEKLVADPEVEIAALLSACGLSFDRRCVEFHKNERVVDTMSAAQVKQPLNRGSIERWTLFREHLAPLSAELSEEP